MSNLPARWCHSLPAPLAALMLASTVTAQPCHRWEVVDWVISPDCDGYYPWARTLRGLNRHGDIVGDQRCIGTSPRPFLIRDGEFQLLTHPDVSSGIAYDINDAGVVVGYVFNSKLEANVGFSWHDGEWTFAVPEEDGPRVSALLHVNDAGISAGRAVNSGESTPHTVRYDLQTGGIERIGERLIPEKPDRPKHIDDAGRIAGDINLGGFATAPFVEWTLGTPTRLPLPPATGDRWIQATSARVSDFDVQLGVAVGQLYWVGRDGNWSRAATWQRDGGVTQLPSPADAQYAFVRSIAGPEFLIGYVQTMSDSFDVAWIAGEMTRLVRLVDAPFEIRDDELYDTIGPASDGSIAVRASIRLDGLPEFLTALMLARPRAASRGDLNCDGVVDFDDVERLIAHWGPCPDSAGYDDGEPRTRACGHDLNGDGEVSNRDLLILFEHWSG